MQKKGFVGGLSRALYLQGASVIRCLLTVACFLPVTLLSLLTTLMISIIICIALMINFLKFFTMINIKL